MMLSCGRTGVLPGFLVLSLTGSAEAQPLLKSSKVSSPAAGATTSDPGDQNAPVLRLPVPLKSGLCKVNGRVTSADSHKVKGSFPFQMRP